MNGNGKREKRHSRQRIIQTATIVAKKKENSFEYQRVAVDWQTDYNESTKFNPFPDLWRITTVTTSPSTNTNISRHPQNDYWILTLTQWIAVYRINVFISFTSTQSIQSNKHNTIAWITFEWKAWWHPQNFCSSLFIPFDSYMILLLTSKM